MFSPAPICTVESQTEPILIITEPFGFIFAGIMQIGAGFLTAKCLFFRFFPLFGGYFCCKMAFIVVLMTMF
jgi:hypothetical protein